MNCFVFLPGPTTLFVPPMLSRMSTTVKQARVKTRVTVATSVIIGSEEELPEDAWGQFHAVDSCLRLSQTLQSGQAFRWRRMGERVHTPSPSGIADEWVGVIGRRLFVLRQTVPRPPDGQPDPVWYRMITPTLPLTEGAEALVHDAKTSTLDARTSTMEAKTSTQDAKTSTQDAKTSTKDAKTSTQDAKTSTQDAKTSAQDAETLAEDTKTPAKGAKISAQDTKAPTKDTEAEEVLRDYFRADTDFSEMYAKFCAADEAFAQIYPYLSGLRMLRTPPEECFFSFICSSNNHIKRISSMVQALADTYGGEPVGQYEGVSYSAFPSAESLTAQAEEQKLRTAGFGYRAKFIASSARGLVQHAERAGAKSVEDMLLSWRNLNRTQVARLLTRYPGVGRKVAGCIALISMDKLGEIPVDTHVWKVAQRYMPDLITKSLTSRVYEDIGDWFRTRFGEEEAGVAHLFLFAGELAEFKKNALPAGLDPWGREAIGTKEKAENTKVVKSESAQNSNRKPVKSGGAKKPLGGAKKKVKKSLRSVKSAKLPLKDVLK